MLVVKKTSAGEDDIFDCTVDLPPLMLTKQEYEAEFLRSEVKKNWDGSHVAKVFLHFVLLCSGERTCFELYMACNGPRGTKWPASSKYTRAWIIAAGHQPKRSDRLTPKVFEGKRFKVRVRVVEQNSHKQPLAPDQQYSVIDDVLECLGPIPLTTLPANPATEHTK
jgi:hypothetical protein